MEISNIVSVHTNQWTSIALVKVTLTNAHQPHCLGVTLTKGDQQRLGITLTNGNQQHCSTTLIKGHTN